MNNWRLLLLALVAVFQPISSFTERNLVDGRQQCCDRQSPTLFRDTRSSLHGTYRYDKTSPALRRLNDRDEIREGRRYELRQRDSVFTRPSTERPQLETQERGIRQGPSAVASSYRVEHRLEIADDRSQDRETTARNIRDLKSLYQTRRIVDRTSRDVLGRRDERANIEYSRRSLSRDDNRANRFSNERLSKNMYNSELDMQREQFRSGELRLAPNKEVRDVLRRTRNDVVRVEAANYLNNRQQIARERLSVVRRETSVRLDTRRALDNNNERRELERHSEQGRIISENTRQIRDVRIRLSSREENRENRHLNIAHKRLTTERFDERRQQRDDYMESRQQNKENTDRRLSRERMQISRRIDVDDRREIRNNERMTRETRKEIRENTEGRQSHKRIQMDRKNSRESRNMKTLNERNVHSRGEIRYELTRETRDEIRANPGHRLSHERIQMNRENVGETRMMNTLNERDSQAEIIHHDRISRATRDERESAENRLSHKSIQMDRRNIREFRIVNNMITRNNRDIDSRREINNNIRTKRETRDEIRENGDRLSHERIQMDQMNIRQFKIMNDMITRNNRDIDSRLENKRLSRENRVTSNRRLSHERIQTDRKNTRESRIMDGLNERNMDSRREIRYNELFRQTRDGIREDPVQTLSRERIQMERNDNREYRLKNTLNVRNMDNQREIRHNERWSGDTRDEIRENLDQRLARESRQMDRRNVRESRLMNDMAIRNERGVESRRDIRYNERYSRTISNNQERRLESRSLGRITTVERDNLVTDRSAHSVDRQNLRELRVEPKLSRSADLERGSDVFRSRLEHRNKIETRERTVDARFRSVESTRNRESTSSVMVGKMETENDLMISNWQYVLYTLQGAYLCALFMQMLSPSRTEKAHKMNLRWLPLSSHYNPIKVD